MQLTYARHSISRLTAVYSMQLMVHYTVGGVKGVVVLTPYASLAPLARSQPTRTNAHQTHATRTHAHTRCTVASPA